MATLTVTLLSNGHGEDTIGASLVTAFQKLDPALKLQAFPTVDEGNAYVGLDIPILGPRQAMPSSGLLMHNWALFKGDINAGFLPMTLQQLRDLRKLKTDALIVIGDGYASLLSSIVKTKQRFYLQSLVSAHHAKEADAKELSKSLANRFFMENLSYPERALMRHLMTRVYVRDDATEQLLKTQGLTHVSCLGNPMLDVLAGQVMPEHKSTAKNAPIIALLPGTRQYAAEALDKMLTALTQLSNTTALVAWAGGDLPEHFIGWQEKQSNTNQKGLCQTLEHNTNQVFIYEGRFADILHTADLVLGTSGTANEQAAALAKPVISFSVPPLYSQVFLENQKRLLGEGLSICSSEPSTIATTIRHLLTDDTAYARAALVGQSRMGKTGGSDAIVKDILHHLKV